MSPRNRPPLQTPLCLVELSAASAVTHVVPHTSRGDGRLRLVHGLSVSRSCETLVTAFMPRFMVFHVSAAFHVKCASSSYDLLLRPLFAGLRSLRPADCSFPRSRPGHRESAHNYVRSRKASEGKKTRGESASLSFHQRSSAGIRERLFHLLCCQRILLSPLIPF